MVVTGLVCQELGASLAVLLFPALGPLGIVFLRLGFSAVILMVIARPRLRGHTPTAWRSVVGFGLVLALMNCLFYLALARLPLGVTVTIEVLGPLVLSVIAARRASAWLWAGLALIGVIALAGGGWDRLDRSASCSRSGRHPAGRCTSSPPRASGVNSRAWTDLRWPWWWARSQRCPGD